MSRELSVKKWITRCFIVTAILAVLLYSVINLRTAYTDIIRADEAEAIVCARNVISLIDTECSLDTIDSSPGDEIFTEAREVLHELCRSSGADYVYIYSIDPENNTRYYHVSAGRTEAEDRTALEEFSRRRVNAQDLLPAEKNILDGSKEMQRALIKYENADSMVWICPYYDDGKPAALIGMDYEVRQLHRRVARSFLADLVPFVLLLLGCMLIILNRIQKRMVRPLAELSDSMKKFALDSRVKPEPLSIPDTDEIGHIAAAYEKMTEDISTYVNNIDKLMTEKLTNDVQLGIARRIQNGLVPEKKDLEGAGFAISAATNPARAVGGDFYDFFIRDDNKICVMIGDVSGKGLYAAIYMAVVKTALHEKLSALGPAESLNRLNRDLWAQNPENMFVTVFAVVFDPENGELVYANAGHTYPLLAADECGYVYPDNGIALGLFEDADLKDHKMTLLPGQGIVMYTDGVTEAVNKDSEFFGTKNLLDAVTSAHAASAGAKEYITRISSEVGRFCGQSEPFDDMAVLVLMHETY